MQEIYKGVKVTYDEHNNEFVAQTSGNYLNCYRHAELGRVRAHIDKAIKKEFKPITALRRPSYSYREKAPVEKVTITSVTENGEVWIKNSNNRREKSVGPFYKYTKKNARTVGAIRKLTERQEKLRQAERDKWQTLDQIDTEAIAKKMSKLEVEEVPAQTEEA